MAKKTVVEHSPQFESLKKKYEMNYVRIDQLRHYVALHEKRYSVGISAEEFEEITGIPY